MAKKINDFSVITDFTNRVFVIGNQLLNKFEAFTLQSLIDFIRTLFYTKSEVDSRVASNFAGTVDTLTFDPGTPVSNLIYRANAGAGIYTKFKRVKTGTITTTSGSAALVGVGTKFLTELAAGMAVNNSAGTLIGTVLSVTDDTHATFAANASVVVTGVVYNGPIQVLPTDGFVDFIFSTSTGFWTKSPSKIDLSNYITKATLAANNQFGETVGAITSLVNPTGIVIFITNNSLDSRGNQTWYTGVTTKVINNVSFPIVRQLSNNLPFTDSVYARIAINGVFLFTQEITLAQINAAGLNATTTASPVESFMYSFDVPQFIVQPSDAVYIVLGCKSATDKMGFAYTQASAGEWAGLTESLVGAGTDVSTLTSPPTKPSSNGYSFPVRLNYSEFITTKINRIVPGLVAAGVSATAISKTDAGTLLKFGSTSPVVSNVINPPLTVYKANNILDARGYQTWFVGVSDKMVTGMSVPIVRRLTDNLAFTDSVIVRLAINSVFIYTREITLSEINAAGLNATTVSSGNEDFMFTFDLPLTFIHAADVIYAVISCKASTDRMGFGYTQSIAGEWFELRQSSTAVDITTLTTPPTKPASSTSYAIAVRFNFNDYIQKKINDSVPALATKKYSDIAYSRKEIAPFATRRSAQEMLKVATYGDSIVIFQNSEQLILSDQKTAPLGLAANNWSRQFWQGINYNVYSNDRTTIVNQNGNLGFKRFDHVDAVASNGYQGTAGLVGSKDWGTNRNDVDATESWRNNNFNTGFVTPVMAESSFLRPMLGTIKTGATFVITVPSTAIGMSIVFGQSPSTSVGIKINNGTTDVVNETINLATAATTTEYHRDYTLTAGTTKTITVTNNTTSALWIWGVEYWSANAVRLINSGIASYNVDLLNTYFDAQVKNHNPDMVVFEVPSENDKNQSSWTLADHATKIETLFNKLDALNIPVIIILTHRFVTDNVDRATTTSSAFGTPAFIPDNIKNYSRAAYKRGFAVINMFKKSCDDLGYTNTISPPTNYFVDTGHPGSVLNKSYADELKRLMWWDDFE